MRATVLRNKALVFDGVPTPEPGNGEVLVKTLACGVCGSDLHAAKHADQLADALRRSDAILLRSFKRDRKEASKGTEGKGSLGSETEQLRHEFCFGHHVFLCYPSHSSLANHMHRLDPFQRSSGTGKGFVT